MRNTPGLQQAVLPERLYFSEKFSLTAKKGYGILNGL